MNEFIKRGDMLKQKKRWIGLISLVLVLLVLIGCGAVYVSDDYRADLDAMAAFSWNTEISETKLDHAIAFGTGEEHMGLIFYPGGKVEYTAYVPLMRALAEKGIFCVVVEMPLNLAVLDMDAAEDIRKRFPNMETWYIGGHSLGGSMAASHLGEHVEQYKGLVLLGSYSTEDLSETELCVLSIYGSEDRIMNREKYEKYKENLPGDFTETIMDGGCHAYFGMYGAQKGDGIPTITPEEQIRMTADLIVSWIEGGAK